MGSFGDDVKTFQLVAVVILSAAVGGAVSSWLRGQDELVDGDPGSGGEIEAQVAALTREVAAVREAQAEQERVLETLGFWGASFGQAPARSDLPSEAPRDARTARAPEDERGTSPEVEAAAAADGYITRLHVQNLGFEEHQRLWQQIRDAGLTDRVVAHFEARAEANPEESMAQYEAGVAYLEKVKELGNTPAAGNLSVAADAAFDRALELDADNWQARFVKGLALSYWPPITGKRAEAIRQFEILRDRQHEQPRHDGHAQTYLLLGNLYQQSGKDAEARQVWAEGSAQFPENAELKSRLAGS